MGRHQQPVALAALDLDGTLTRGETVSEAIAGKLGRLERMRELEAADGDRESTRRLREEVAEWFRGHPIDELREPLSEIDLASGTREAFDRLREAGVETAIVSLTWEFAVAYFAAELGADHHVGTTFHPQEGITSHFWAADKPVWLRDLTDDLGIEMSQVTAVGDSFRDHKMLRACGRAYYVGGTLPAELEDAHHLPDGDMAEIAAHMLGPTAGP